MHNALVGLLFEGVEVPKLWDAYHTWSGTLGDLKDLKEYQAAQILGVRYIFHVGSDNAVVAKLRSISAKMRNVVEFLGSREHNAADFSYFYEVEKIAKISRRDFGLYIQDRLVKGQQGWAVSESQMIKGYESFIDKHESVLLAPPGDPRPMSMAEAAESLALFYRVHPSQISISLEHKHETPSVQQPCAMDSTLEPKE